MTVEDLYHVTVRIETLVARLAVLNSELPLGRCEECQRTLPITHRGRCVSCHLVTAGVVP